MTIRLMAVLIFLALPCFAASGNHGLPSSSEIRKWWNPQEKKRPDEPLEVRDLRAIRLKSGEAAFVASVAYPERARCCAWGILLVRPNLHEAREVGSLCKVTRVLDLDHDGISEVVTTGSFLGQGATSGQHRLLNFDGWKPVVLYEKDFGDVLGGCGMEVIGHRCTSKEVTWFFTDLDGDWDEDLVELIVFKEGKESDELKWTSRVRAYKLTGKELVPTQPDLKLSDMLQSKSDADARPGNSADEREDACRKPRRHSDKKAGELPEPERSGDETETCEPKPPAPFISELPSAIDQAATTVRDILSQFGLIRR